MNLETHYRRFGAALYRHALALCGSADDAEDALHGVFLKLAGPRWPWRRIRDVEAYLHTAVRRQVLRLQQKRQGERTGSLKDFDLVTPVNGSPPEGARRLNEALRRLPPEQREVVLLHVIEGLSFARIGELLGIPVDTAASRYRYAKEKLESWCGRSRP